jgi:hypothetical protein
VTPGVVYRLHALILVVYFIVAWVVWPLLPERVPLAAVAMALFCYGMARLARRAPDLWNIPERQRFAKLPPERRAPLEDRLEASLGVCGIVFTFMLAAIQVLVYLTATGRGEGLSWLPVVVIVLGTAAMVGVTWREAVRVGHEIRRLSHAGE